MNKVILSGLFVILASLFLVPWIHGNDGAGYYSYVRSAFIDHDLNLGDEKEYFSQQFSVNSILLDNSTAVYYSQYPIGVSLLWAPFFALAHMDSVLLGLPADGYSFVYILMVSLGSAVLAFLGILASYSVCSEFFSRRTAFISVLSFWISSNLFYYMFFEASMSHACSFFAVSLFVFFWFRVYEKGSFAQWFVLGLLSALVVMVRYQDGVFLLIPLVFSIARYYSFAVNRSVKKLVVMFSKNSVYIAGFFLGLAPQLFVLKYQHGAYFSALQNYQTSINFVHGFVHVAGVLFSSNHGLFLWTPVALLGFLGLFGAALKTGGKKKFFAQLFIIAFLAQLLFVASTAEWHGAQSFSHRMFVSAGVFLVFGLCFSVDFIEKHFGRKVSVFILVILCLWNFGLMAQYGLRMIPAEGAVSFVQVFYNFFFELPSRVIEALSIIRG